MIWYLKQHVTDEHGFVITEIWYRVTFWEKVRSLFIGRKPSNSDLKEMEKRIMSEISEFAAKVEENFGKISDGIKALDAKIIQLQQNMPSILPDDQKALLQKIVDESSALAAAAQSMPTPPVAEPPVENPPNAGVAGS